MQEGTLPAMAPKASKMPFYSAIAIFATVIAVTIGLTIMNTSLASKAESLNEAARAKSIEIAEVSKDKNVVVTKILSTNTIPPTLNLRGLIASFRDVAAKANVRLKGFNVNRDVISTSLIATEGNPNIHPDPASTIVTMMRAYMAENGDGRFTLEPIRSIGGDGKTRTTSIVLHVVPAKK